ncbi:MAG: hypothetical protein J6Z36_01195 [Clostridia bacterium]|nr:hypothetical protein [Clostridia bacterium]
MFENMSEEKLKRTVTGLTVAGTLLVLILLAVIIYQIVVMGVKSARIKDLETKIAWYEQQITEGNADLDYYLNDDDFLRSLLQKEGFSQEEIDKALENYRNSQQNDENS